jgi:flagellar motor switch protein FliN/FliY
MIVNQEEIEAMLTQTENVAQEVTDDPAGQAPAPRAGSSSPPSSKPVVDAPLDVARIRKLRVPVIVLLASRRMDIAAVRKLALGMIIEFDKDVGDPLDLLINNHPIGRGEAIKVGEHFGLRISEIRDQATRIRSMGS